MTLEETGAYIKLLCFQAAKGSLQEKDILKKIPLAIWGAICCHFKNEKSGFYNERLRLEIEKRRLFTESRRKNLHMESHMDNHMDGVLTPHMENENENENKDIKKGVVKGKTIPPILEEVIAYCKERNSLVNPTNWFNFYESKGWMIGKNKMVDWRAAVRTWENKETKQIQSTQSQVRRDPKPRKDCTNCQGTGKFKLENGKISQCWCVS